jgi:hypothetical protein
VGGRKCSLRSICHCCVDQIKRKSACPCKEGVGVGGSEKHGDNGTNITALCCYTLLCVEPYILGGMRNQRTKWEPDWCPTPFQSCCNYNFNCNHYALSLHHCVFLALEFCCFCA